MYSLGHITEYGSQTFLQKQNSNFNVNEEFKLP